MCMYTVHALIHVLYIHVYHATTCTCTCCFSKEPTTAEDEETQEASSVEKELNSVGNSPSQEVKC